jgi:hypothetical protein
MMEGEARPVAPGVVIRGCKYFIGYLKNNNLVAVAPALR